MLYHILDTETSGLGNAGVCEIAWLVIDEDFNINSEFCSLVNPEMPIQEGATAIHGIRDEDVVDKPTLAEIAAKHLKEPINLIGHNSKFDKRMIKEHVKFTEELCTLALARTYIKNTTNHKLETLQVELNLPVQKSHSALGDVHTCRDLLLYLRDNFNVSLVEELARAKIPKLVHKMPFGKHKGRGLLQIPADYRAWLLGQEIDKDLRFSLERIKGM